MVTGTQKRVPSDESPEIEVPSLPEGADEICQACWTALQHRLRPGPGVIERLRGATNPEERAAGCLEELRILCPLRHDEAQQPSGIGHTVYSVVRRIADIIVALIGLALLLVLLPILAPLIWIQSPGPIFFSQERVGRDGTIFTIPKIRTMHRRDPNAEALWATDDRERARIFPVGRFLRKTHIDELPQFWNVLVGEMSLIGPRPEQVPIVDDLAKSIPGYHLRHCVRPGITGLRQVEYGYVGTEIGSWLSTGYDLYYISNQGPRLDLYICLRTVPRILCDRDQPEAKKPVDDEVQPQEGAGN